MSSVEDEVVEGFPLQVFGASFMKLTSDRVPPFKSYLDHYVPRVSEGL